MPELKTKLSFSDRIIERLPAILIVLFVLQPFMDILSYWMDRRVSACLAFAFPDGSAFI